MMKRLSLITGAALAIGIMSNAQAADVASGREVARKLCVNCHIVEPDGQQDKVMADIPSFMAIANKAGQTEDKIKGFILDPHPPMPQVQLTTNEIENVVSYIMSLKKEK
jgi:cytochrome c